MRSLEWALIQMAGVLKKVDELTEGGQRTEKTDVHKPRTEASGETDPADTLISGVQPGENIEFCCVSHSVCINWPMVGQANNPLSVI